jgi:hypothetical protein
VNRAQVGNALLDLPDLEDANSIQVALMQVMHLLLSGHIEPKTQPAALGNGAQMERRRPRMP